jgi:hypothetical protein
MAALRQYRVNLRTTLLWLTAAAVAVAVVVLLLVALAVIEIEFFGTRTIVGFYERIGIRDFIGSVYGRWLWFLSRLRIPRGA